MANSSEPHFTVLLTLLSLNFKREASLWPITINHWVLRLKSFDGTDVSDPPYHQNYLSHYPFWLSTIRRTHIGGCFSFFRLYLFYSRLFEEKEFLEHTHSCWGLIKFMAKWFLPWVVFISFQKAAELVFFLLTRPKNTPLQWSETHPIWIWFCHYLPVTTELINIKNALTEPLKSGPSSDNSHSHF